MTHPHTAHPLSAFLRHLLRPCRCLHATRYTTGHAAARTRHGMLVSLPTRHTALCLPLTFAVLFGCCFGVVRELRPGVQAITDKVGGTVAAVNDGDGEFLLIEAAGKDGSCIFLPTRPDLVTFGVMVAVCGAAKGARRHLVGSVGPAEWMSHGLLGATAVF